MNWKIRNATLVATRIPCLSRSPLCSARQHSVCNVPGNRTRKVGESLTPEHLNVSLSFACNIPGRPKLPVVKVRIIPTWESSHLGDRMKWREKRCRNMTWLWDKLCAALQITAAFGYFANAAPSIFGRVWAMLARQRFSQGLVSDKG